MQCIWILKGIYALTFGSILIVDFKFVGLALSSLPAVPGIGLISWSIEKDTLKAQVMLTFCVIMPADLFFQQREEGQF
jgi:hypothetical protein